MPIDIEAAKTEAVDAATDSLMAKYGPQGAKEADMRDLAEGMAPGIAEAILQHILDNAEAGGDPVE